MVKKLLMMLMMAAMAVAGATGQEKSYDLCHYKNGAVVYRTAVSDVDSIAFAESDSAARAEMAMAEPEYVDLGLPSGLLWATRNLGAEKSYESGEYFPWGMNSSTKENLGEGWLLYGMTYEELKGLYIDERGGNLLGGADPVYYYYGGEGEWRMPTREDFIELFMLPHVSVEVNGVNGYMFVGKTGKTLFLPSVGGYCGDGPVSKKLIGEGEVTMYWTATAYAEEDGKMYFAGLNEKEAGTAYWSGSSALPVRPVKGKKTETNKLGFVDLGLKSGTLWATYNVGATKPEEYGDYFAWGEFVTKDEYTEENCMRCGLEYSDLEAMGIIDANGNLTAKNDAATVNFGKEWRMPTEEEIVELSELPNKVAEVNGVKGTMFKGTNGNTLFLPLAGSCEDGFTYAGEGGYYWSATVFEQEWGAYYLQPYFQHPVVGLEAIYSFIHRSLGFSVRPVLRIK